MSEYKGRIAVGAILALVIVFGLAFELNTLVPSNTTGTMSTSTGTSTVSSAPSVTSWFGSEQLPTNCGDMTWGGGGAGYGYNETTYHSQNVQFGGDVCIYTYFQNLSNQSTALPTNENVTITYANTPGIVYYENECVAPPYSGSFGPNSPGWNCIMTWDSANGYNGTSAHPVIVGLSEPDEFLGQVAIVGQSSLVGGGGFTVYFASETSTTSSVASGNYCGTPPYGVLTPTQGGPVYLKVVTDQGATIANGSVLVTHTGAMADGMVNVTSYCLRLGDGNATGYIPLTVNGSGVSSIGPYNLTLVAGYGQGAGYQAVLSNLIVQPNSTVYATISVPSGKVTIVTCTAASGCATTTTTVMTTDNIG
jgi:hypothetical protein